MTITETKNPDEPILRRPKFVVDYKIKDIVKPFPDQASYMVFVGKSRSGKSSLLTSLLLDKKMYRKAFHNILYVVPQHSFTSMAENPDNPFLEIDPDKIYHDLDFDVLSSILTRIHGYAEQGEDTLLIFDDFSSEIKHPRLLRLLNRAVNNRRHERLSIWMSVQTYRSIPLSNRKTINYLVMFKPSNAAEQKSVWEEMTMLSRDKFDELCAYVFDRPHQYMVLDRDNDEYYKGFSKLTIT